MPVPAYHCIYGAANPMPRLIKDHIAANCVIERNDFDYSPFPTTAVYKKLGAYFPLVTQIAAAKITN